MVHGGVRYARYEGGQGTARRASKLEESLLLRCNRRLSHLPPNIAPICQSATRANRALLAGATIALPLTCAPDSRARAYAVCPRHRATGAKAIVAPASAGHRGQA